MTAGLRVRPAREEVRRRAEDFLQQHRDRSDWTAREMIPFLGLNPWSQASALREELRRLADQGRIERVALDPMRAQARVAYRAYPEDASG